MFVRDFVGTRQHRAVGFGDDQPGHAAQFCDVESRPDLQILVEAADIDEHESAREAAGDRCRFRVVVDAFTSLSGL